MRLLDYSPFSIIQDNVVYYPAPSNLSYLYSFGLIAGILLFIQILTGTFLAMHYTPETSLAFDSIEHIMRDVNNG